MKQYRIIQFISAMLCAMVLLIFDTMSASANSAQSRWEGVDSSGVIITGEDSPIVVENEVLTFDIQEFPANHYTDVEEFLAYSGKVTAEYTFYNPADYAVTAKLLFPFGNDPTYAYFYDYETDMYTYNTDTGKYDITVNGEAIEKTIRHTLTYASSQFNLEEDLSLVSNGYVKDDFYFPELSVTKYTYRIADVDLEEYDAANVAFNVAEDLDSTVVYFPEASGGHTQDNGEMRISAWVEENGQTATLYAIGKPFSTMPKLKFYENGGTEDKEEIDGKATLKSIETITFQEFALANWNEETGVSQTDWYNAVVAELREDAKHYSHPIVDLERYEQGYRGSLMRWYEYEITFEPGKRIINAVTAPIYPSIDMDYTSAIHGYTYLLSPAKTWAEFGKLDIVINTQYYITESSIEGFTKNENGYTLTLDGLPEGELEFTLCSSENPKKEVETIQNYIPLGIIIILLSGGIVVFAMKQRSKR